MLGNAVAAALPPHLVEDRHPLARREILADLVLGVLAGHQIGDADGARLDRWPGQPTLVHRSLRSSRDSCMSRADRQSTAQKSILRLVERDEGASAVARCPSMPFMRTSGHRRAPGGSYGSVRLGRLDPSAFWPTNPAMLVFIDESGDAGFDVAKGASP
ncbi:MAG TPA: hypothetical protein VKS60_02090, partial [Stellaceae bacterium]|nr:hypothetical protein [Stellaceae bacterium]